MREITLHLLDIAENSVSAGAKNITVVIEENYATDRLYVSIEDDGKGMDEDTIAAITDPFTTSRTERKVGLGIPLLKAAAEACQGSLSISSKLGIGTKLEVDFQHSHIDRMPLGDVAATIYSLVVAHSEVHWKFTYRTIQTDGKIEEFVFDDQPIKETLGEIPLTEPSVLSFIKEMVYEGVSRCQNSKLFTGE